MSASNSRALYSPGFVKWIRIMLIAALLAGLLPAAAFAAPQAAEKCTPTYQVRRGDTLSKIGSRYGWDASQIVYINGWSKPYTIYVGQNICLPTKKQSGLAELESKYANATAAFFTAGRTSDSVVVYTFNYPKTSVLVRVDNAGDSKKNYVTVGTINIATSGNNKSWKFKLPADLRKAPQIQICLKDLTTSYLQCVFPRTGS